MKPLCMASLPLLATLFFSLLCFSEASDLIAQICSKAANPPLCTQVLTSDPRSSGADLKGLGLIILEKSAAATGDVASIVKSIGGGAADVCIETCGNAIDELKNCSELLESCGGASCKGDLQTKGSAAHTNVVTCEDAFGGGGPPELKEATKRAQDLIDVFLVVANTFSVFM